MKACKSVVAEFARKLGQIAGRHESHSRKIDFLVSGYA